MGKIARYKKNYKYLIINTIYSFYFSCFTHFVPALGTVNSVVNC